MNKLPPAPVILIVGSQEHAVLFIEEELQKQFCAQAQATAVQNKAIDCYCRICRSIKQRQHPSLVWLAPEGNYTVKDIDIIFQKTQFALEQNSEFFFVIPDVHSLNLATANRLLKVLEEPPRGYRFLLYTQNAQAVLPTILSRSVRIDCAVNQQADFLHPLLNFVCDQRKIDDALGFEALLKKEHLSDQQSFELLNNLLNHCIGKLKDYCAQPELSSEELDAQERLENSIAFITQALKRPPQPGSSEIFWKYFFIWFPRL